MKAKIEDQFRSFTFRDANSLFNERLIDNALNHKLATFADIAVVTEFDDSRLNVPQYMTREEIVEEEEEEPAKKKIKKSTE